MADMLTLIRRIEHACYPPHMRQMQDCLDREDLVEYCEGEPDILTWDGGYAIAVRETREVVDLASTRPLGMRDMVRILRWLGPGRWTADLRADTSLLLVKAFARRGRITLEVIEEWSWDGHRMAAVEITIPAGVTPHPGRVESSGEGTTK